MSILSEQTEFLPAEEAVIPERRRGNSRPSFPKGPAAPSLASGLSALAEGVFVWLWLSSFSFPLAVSYFMSSGPGRDCHGAPGSPACFRPEPLALVASSLAKAGWGFEKWHWLDARLVGAIAGEAPHQSPAQNETDSYTLLVGAQTAALLREAPFLSLLTHTLAACPALPAEIRGRPCVPQPSSLPTLCTQPLVSSAMESPRLSNWINPLLEAPEFTSQFLDLESLSFVAQNLHWPAEISLSQSPRLVPPLLLLLNPPVVTTLGGVGWNWRGHMRLESDHHLGRERAQ